MGNDSPVLAQCNGYQDAEAAAGGRPPPRPGGQSPEKGPEVCRLKETDRATYQAMEALVHNLNTMHSRAGAQMPFQLHQLRHRHLARGPDGDPQICCWPPRRGWAMGRRPSSHPDLQGQGGVNYNPGTPTTTCSSWPARVPSGCSPTSPSWTPPSTCNTTRKGYPKTEVAYMGCRTRVMGNVTTPPGDHLRPGQPELYLHQPAPFGHQGQRQHRHLLRGAGPEDGPGHGPAPGPL